MNMSQRITRNNERMAEESGMVLPSIELKSGSRVQSATKRSTQSLRQSANFSERSSKKGPVRAFDPMPAASMTFKEKSAKPLDKDDRFDSVQVIDKFQTTNSKNGPLKPIDRGSLQSSKE